MSIDLHRAHAFMAAHARVLDRRRFEATVLESDAARSAIVTGLAAYRNADGGYGWGIEPDLRASESQPGGALHAFEALSAAAPCTSPNATELLEWLARTSLDDGGLPFALPVADATACAPFWVNADPAESSLQITAAVAAQAHRAARWDVIRTHPWLEQATQYCFEQIRRIEEPPFAYVLLFSLQLLDITAETHVEAGALLERLMRFVPADGALPVAGGAEGETVRVSSEPGRPLYALLDRHAVEDGVDRLERAQQSDGGWPVDFTTYSEAAALEWRGYVTANAIATLRERGRV